VLDGSAAQVAAIPVDWNAFLGARHVNGMPVYERVVKRAATTVRGSAPSGAAATAKPAVAAGTSLVQELTDAVPARRSGVLRGYLRTRVAKTLGLGEGRVVDDKQPLRDAGLDSLLAIELRNVLGAAIGRTLPATLLFDYPTIDDLAVHLLATLFPSALAAAPVAPEPVVETPVNLVDDLSSMSDDDVDRLFAEKMRGKS
jgi:acyl carrier protein